MAVATPGDRSYVGSAQGTRRPTFESIGDDDVFRVRGISCRRHSQSSATRYFDRDFQKVDVATVDSLTIERPGEPPLSFVKDAEGVWSIPDRPMPAGKQVDQTQTQTFVQSTVNARMMEPHGRQETPEMGLDNGVVVTWTTTVDGATEQNSYRVGSPVASSNGRRYLKSSTSPFVLEVLESQMDHALSRGIDDLYTEAAPQ